MNARAKLRNTLKISGALCDDCLSSSAAVKPRQQVNQRCREMSNLGELTRQRDLCPQCKSVKIVNRLKGSNKSKPDQVRTTAALQHKIVSTNEPEKPWFWEGNVQDKIIEYLQSNGWQILSSADTASKQPGKDIVAKKNGKELWVSVKGIPEKSVNVQARHWFSGAIFDMVLYKGENPDVQLAIGLPANFSTYRNLIPRVSWLRRNLPFKIISVTEEGAVEVTK